MYFRFRLRGSEAGQLRPTRGRSGRYPPREGGGGLLRWGAAGGMGAGGGGSGLRRPFFAGMGAEEEVLKLGI